MPVTWGVTNVLSLVPVTALPLYVDVGGAQVDMPT